ncbi:MAG: hypothetical protein M0P71_01115 [Melioribacteraceae bacterium]|nr:hypothetical protein [Melioribacteraceae bacterium]
MTINRTVPRKTLNSRVKYKEKSRIDAFTIFWVSFIVLSLIILAFSF